MVGTTDIANLKESQDFLLRVRNEIHFTTGRHQDQLTFEQQENVSAALGFDGEEALRGVEVFMRTYYLTRGADQPAVELDHLIGSPIVISRVFLRATYSDERCAKGYTTVERAFNVTKAEMLKDIPGQPHPHFRRCAKI